MPRRSAGIMFLLIIILIAFSISIFNGVKRIDPNNENYRQAIGLYPIVIAVVLTPFLVAFLSNSSPEQPVTGIHRACQIYEHNKKFEAIRPYLSKNFLRSPKVLMLVQWHPENIHSLNVEVTEERQRMLVRVILKNDEYYVFTVQRREEYIDPAGTSDWVVDDITGLGF